MEKVKKRKTKSQSWFLDLSLMLGYWDSGGKRAYHHTAPVNLLYGLHEALCLLQQEGLENAWARHRLHHNALKAGLTELGIELVVPEAERLPQLNAVSIPENIEDGVVRKKLLEEFNLEIGAGLGESAGKLWRIGLMGYSANRGNVLYCISALAAVLGELGGHVQAGKALEEVSAVYEN